MNRLSSTSRRRLAGLLAAVWLLVSNAALCLALPGASGAHAHGEASAALSHVHDSHAGHGAADGHHPPAAEVAAGDPQAHAAHACCAQTVMPPCCADASVAPGFGLAWTAQLAIAPPPPPALALLPASVPSWRESREQLPDWTGPPTYLRCCSLLI